MIDITGLSYTEMKELQDRLQAEAKRLITDQLESIRVQVQAVAEQNGTTVSDVLNQLYPPIPKPAVPSVPKYAHPSDPNKTWSGRGKKPQWLADLISDQTPLESFRIAASEGSDGDEDGDEDDSAVDGDDTSEVDLPVA